MTTIATTIPQLDPGIHAVIAQALPIKDAAALLCWNCATPLSPLTASNSTDCPSCEAVTENTDGIWRCLAPDQARAYDRFIADYEFIRAAEGRGSLDPAHYLALPHQDLSGRNTTQWNIRARTFNFFVRRILSPRATRPLRILDLGAGNGWLSYRLSQLGHSPVAVDLLTNSTDGLGAAAAYIPHLSTMFPRVQASLDTLPFASATFDLAIFNASFHYSQDYTITLAEALRCLRPGGAAVIADTPWYSHHQSGEQMVAEKHRHFLRMHGIASDNRPSQEFLTPQRLRNLQDTLNIRFQTFKPFYGFEWSLRPLRAALHRRRTPSQFRIFLAEAAA